MPVELLYGQETDDFIIFVAKCHGAEQRIEIPISQIDISTIGTIELGLAFNDERTEEQELWDLLTG